MNYLIDPETVEIWPLERHNGVTVKLLVNGQNMTVLWSRWEPNASAPEHTHPHEQIGICLQGQIVFIINGEDHVVNAGEYFHIPPNVPHAERNDGSVPAILTDFFSPVRSDLIERRFQPNIIGE